MESMHDKLDKLQTDLAAVEELYSFGAKIYPYHKIRAERSVSIQIIEPLSYYSLSLWMKYTKESIAKHELMRFIIYFYELKFNIFNAVEWEWREKKQCLNVG